MEREGLPALKWIFALIFLGFLSTSARSQSGDYFAPQSPAVWKGDPSLFLDPNRFTVEKEMLDRSLWLQVGYGRSLTQVGGVSIGMEGLAWSRLQALSQFRFPVETLDYFFGAFAVWGNNVTNWRLRISHISSHLVDGDSMVKAGSSSEYSREFVELMRQAPLWNGSVIYWALGVRGYFHQVTKIEPWIAFPASLTCSITTKDRNGLYAFVSSGDGPVWPSIAGGLRAQLVGNAPQASGSDLQLYYYYGASWAGTDAGAKVSQLKLQLDVRDF